MKIKFLKSLPYYMLLRCSMQYVVRKINPKFFKPLFLPILLTTFYILLSSTTHAGTIIKSPAYLGLNAGLVGCWSFDGSYTNAPDCSGNNNVGTLTGGPTKTVGKVGQVLSFDGVDDWVNMGSFVPVSGGNPRTVSVWVKVTSSATNRTITSWGSDSVAGQRFTFSINTSNTLSIGIEGSAESAVTAVGDNIWHHVAITCSGNNLNTCKIWVDGRLDKTLTTSATINTSSSDRGLSIGIWPLPFGPFLGQIDETRIYNRALLATDVARLYRIGLGSTANRGTSAEPFDKGLVGHWTFDGPDISGTRAKDRSGNNNHGTLTNGPTTTIGKVGQALNFDGVNDRVDVGDIDFTSGPFSISLWFKTTNQTNAERLLSKWSSITNINYEIYIKTTNPAGLIAGLYDGAFQSSTVNGTFHDGQWHNAVMVVTTSAITAYVDGIAGSVGSHDNSITGNNIQTQIGGATQIGSPNFINAIIDDVRIYNRALSAAEISRLYQLTQSKYNSSQTDSLTKGLVGYWNFDGPNISGTRAKDSSGNNNHGTLTNGPTTTIGKLGQALSFDGSNDYVAIPNNSSIQTNGVITIAAWIYLTSTTAERIIVKGSEYEFDVSGGLLRLNQDNTVIMQSTAYSYINSWHHVVAVYSDSENYTMLCIDASCITEGSETTSIANTSNNVAIGSEPNGGGNFLNGQIDDVRIYNRALSAAEIQKLYNMGR